jgi:LPS export ABC transporter protein LptC
MKFWRHAFAAILLALALGLTIWRGQQAGAPLDAATRSAAEPGYIALDARIVQTGPDGEPLYRLEAARVEQLRSGADILVTRPHLRYQKGSGPEWNLRADSGALPADAGRASLAGSVYAVATQPGTVPLEIRTESLAIDMTAQLVTTPDPVRIDWGRDRMTAVGMRADLKVDTLRLESEVHGEIVR